MRHTTKIIHYVGLVGPKATAFIIIHSKQALHPGPCPHRTNYISSLWFFCLLWPFSQLLSALDGQGRVRGGWEEEELAEHWFSRDLAPESPIGHHQFPCPYPYRFVLILLFLIFFNPVLSWLLYPASLSSLKEVYLVHYQVHKSSSPSASAHQLRVKSSSTLQARYFFRPLCFSFYFSLICSGVIHH